MNEGFCLPHAKVTCAISEVLIEICNGNHVWHVSIVFGYVGTQNVKQLFFAKFGSAWMHARSLKNLDVPTLLRAHAQCMCAHVTCA